MAKPSVCKAILKNAIEANTVCFMTGGPGVGKSSIVREVAKELEYELRDVRASQLDPVDVRGLPMASDGVMKWMLPEFFAGKEGDRVLIFLDELNAATRAVQVALYQPLCERRIGNHPLPSTFRFCAAGNRASDNAVVNRMSTALNNRLAPHVPFDHDLEDWIANFAIPNQIGVERIAFLRARPNLLYTFDPESSDAAFASPRSYELLDMNLKLNPSAEIKYDLIKGIIGEGAGMEYLAFEKLWGRLIPTDVILADPMGAPIPSEKEPDVIYATSVALAHVMKRENMDRAMKYLARLPIEYQTVTVRDALRRDYTLANTAGYINWNSDSKNIVS